MIISESYESEISVNNYKTVLIIIIEFDITAQLLYLKELIYEFNNYQVWTWEIRLI